MSITRRLYGALGSVDAMREDLDRAEEMYRKALALSEELGHKEGMASLCLNLGALYEGKGDMAAACAYLRKARDLWHEIGNPRKVRQSGVRLYEANCPDE